MNNGRRLVETARRLARARLQQQREAVTLNAAAASVSSLRARQDGADLRLALDHPSSASSSSSAASTSTGGLFGYRQLRGPHSLSSLAQSTIRRAQLIVTKITSADVVTTASSSSAEERFLRVVKDLDRLSDTLCRVIDLAEFVRNAHPDERWQDGANEAYETLCEYMNLLNTHTGLYHVRRLSAAAAAVRAADSLGRHSSRSTRACLQAPRTARATSSPRAPSRRRSSATLKSRASTCPSRKGGGLSTCRRPSSSSAVRSSRTPRAKTTATR